MRQLIIGGSDAGVEVMLLVADRYPNYSVTGRVPAVWRTFMTSSCRCHEAAVAALLASWVE